MVLAWQVKAGSGSWLGEWKQWEKGKNNLERRFDKNLVSNREEVRERSENNNLKASNLGALN